MNKAALTLLALLALAGCRHPEPDYQGTRDRSEQQHRSMDDYSKQVTSPQ